MAGTLSILGANSTGGGAGIGGESGELGQEGHNGFGTIELPVGGDGGASGWGGNGGNGGNGSAGRAGGAGSGGAGGGAKFQATLFNATGATINTSPGSGADNGRYIVADNNFDSPNFGTRIGTGTGTSVAEFFAFQEGGGDLNPFVDGGATTTINLADLVGGADNYGIVEGVTVSATYFNTARNNAPAGALAAIMRVNTDPNGNIYSRPLLLMVNLTTGSLGNPRLGITPLGSTSTFDAPLLTRGFAESPSFGGDGADTLSQLAAGAVYATSLPSQAVLDINASVNGASLISRSISSGGIAYFVPILIPEPTTLLLISLGLPALLARRGRQ